MYLPAEVDAGTVMLIIVVPDSLYFIDREEAARLAIKPPFEEDKLTCR